MLVDTHTITRHDFLIQLSSMTNSPLEIKNARERAIGSDHFKVWADAFVKRFAGQKLAKSKAQKAAHQAAPWKKVQVSETLQKIGKLKLTDNAVDALKTNLLFACYLAKHWIDADADHIAREREFYKKRITKLPGVIKTCTALIQYLRKNADLATSALKHSDMSDIGSKALLVSGEVNDVRVVEALLVRLADGFSLMRTPSHPGLLDLTVDYAYGPLLLMNTDRTRVFPTGEKPNIRALGLMFHLTYISRYFTNMEQDLKLPSRMNKHGELIINGPMINCGRANRDIVAHLVNATLEKQVNSCYSGEDIKDRLEYLLESKQAKPPQNRAPFSEIEFFGWSVQLPES